jgi:hypothetical protein
MDQSEWCVVYNGMVGCEEWMVLVVRSETGHECLV